MCTRCGSWALPLKPTNPPLLCSYLGNASKLREKFKRYCVLETFLFQRQMLFPDRRTRRKEITLRQMAVNHCKQWQKALTRICWTSLKNSLFVYRWDAPAGGEESASGVCLATSDRRELVLFFSSPPPCAGWLSIVCQGPFDPSASLHSRALPLWATTPRVRLSDSVRTSPYLNRNDHWDKFSSSEIAHEKKS